MDGEVRIQDRSRDRTTRALGRRFTAFLEALYCDFPVAGLTHSFYRYPARFSPQFARAAIETFTKPGDTVLDPFMGGGTTVVEALALGRRCVGSDLNPLSKFLALVKTTPLSGADIKVLLNWASRLAGTVNLRARGAAHDDWNPYLAELFTTNYAVWIGYHAILQESGRGQGCSDVDDEVLERLLEEDRVRVARMQVKQALEMAKLMQRATQERTTQD